MPKKVIEASTKHIKTMRKSKLESKRYCVLKFPEKGFKSLAIVDSNLWYVACLSNRCIGKCMAKSNSAALQRSLDPIISYNRAWQNVCCIAFLKESLVLSTNEGVSRVILDTSQVIHHMGVYFKQVYSTT